MHTAWKILQIYYQEDNYMCVLIRLNYAASEITLKIQRMKPQHMQHTRINDISAGFLWLQKIENNVIFN